MRNDKKNEEKHDLKDQEREISLHRGCLRFMRKNFVDIEVQLVVQRQKVSGPVSLMWGSFCG